jgi:methylenetetrahydrofolate--tRNA-(uracil-5-)-methyltransferase
MKKRVKIIGAGLAGSECALQLAKRGFEVTLVEMRPVTQTPVHKTSLCAELVCSNSLKSTKPDSAAGMLKEELCALGSFLYEDALKTRVAAGGALAVDREMFSNLVTKQVEQNVNLERREAIDLTEESKGYDALVLATGPLTSDNMARSLSELMGKDYLAFFDAAAPIVMADSLDYDILFKQSRYEEGAGDYLNAPFTKEEYEIFIEELLCAERVVLKDFETKELFQACQPIEEIARRGKDAPRYGALKPVGLVDPRTNKRPWAVVQLRAEDSFCQSYNLVGFQTNLTFSEQKRVFRLIPGLENAEFSRYGVMHRNTFLDAPRLLNENLELQTENNKQGTPVYVAGQLCGTEGYVEAIRSGLHVALAIAQRLQGFTPAKLPTQTAFGSLLAYATSKDTIDYQPSHVNFGIMTPLDKHVKNKAERYSLYAQRGKDALNSYCEQLKATGVL